MLRFYLRLILIPTALFTFVLILIHAQPYDDHELRELLLPEGCPAPCFMGIRPGIMTVEEAVRLLEKNRWVDEVNTAPIDYNAYSTPVTWSWTNQSPRLMREGSIGQIWYDHDSHLVGGVVILTNIPIGNILLTFGLPDLQSINRNQDQKEFIDYAVVYFQKGLRMRSYFACKTVEPLRVLVLLSIEPSKNMPARGEGDRLSKIFRAC